MSARRRSQTQSKTPAAHREDAAVSTKALPPTAVPSPSLAGSGRSTTPLKTGKREAQPPAVMGLPEIPSISSCPQRQSKVDALAKKVWSAIALGPGCKRANSTNQNISGVPTIAADVQPASKKRKGPQTVGMQANASKSKSKRVGRQGGAEPPTVKPSGESNAAGQSHASARTIKNIPRMTVTVESSDSETGEDVPLAQARAAVATNAKKPSAKQEPKKRLTRTSDRRSVAGHIHAKADAPAFESTPDEEVADESQDVCYAESDASNSTDAYNPDEDDEACSEDDELNDPLSKDLEELEAQLREEAPVWTKEKDDKLPPVLHRKQDKKPLLPLELDDNSHSGVQTEEEQPSVGKSAERSTSKGSQHRQLEQPLWKTMEPGSSCQVDNTIGIENADDFESEWAPKTYIMPPPEDSAWEENRVAGDPAGWFDADNYADSLADSDFHPQAYEIKPPVTPGGVLSLKEQHEHIQDIIRHTFIHVESNLLFDNGFPDTVGRARFIYEAMRDSAQELDLGALHRRLGQDPSFARSLATLPNQHISTFRSNIKKNTDSASAAFYALQARDAAEKVAWLFDHLKYIYPVILEPSEKRNATWSKPYQNPAVTSTLHTCFFTGATSIGNREEARFSSTRADREDEREIPMPMLGLVGAALHASLSEWRTGVHKKGTFLADAFLDAYTEHITLLTGIKTQNPRAYHTMMHRLYTEASGTIPSAANLVNASDALTHVDFAGMDVD